MIVVPREYRLCRMLRAHALEGFIPHGRRGPGWGRTFHFRCVRCGTERHDTIDALGDLAARRYIYPDGYRLDRDETPTTQDLRLDYQRTLRAEARQKRRGKRAS